MKHSRQHLLSFVTLYLGGIVAIFPPPHVNGQDARSPDQQLTVESAWSHRKDVIKSLVLNADVVEITKGREDQPAKQIGPLTDNPPKTDRRSDSKIEFYYDEGKAALTHTGSVSTNEDSVKPIKQTFRAAFDGQLNASLFEQTGNFSGSIERKRIAGGFISQNGLLLAVNLWLQPQLMFKDVGWNVSEMKIENDSIEVNGIQCRRIRIPRSSSKWTSAVDADAEREWIPMQWQTWLDGRLTMKVIIQYEIDEKVGPVVSGWSYTRYNNVGESEVIRSGHVTRCEPNVDIAPNHFTIDFPLGTPIWEDTPSGRQYYVQKAKGMVPVEVRTENRKGAK